MHDTRRLKISKSNPCMKKWKVYISCLKLRLWSWVKPRLTNWFRYMKTSAPTMHQMVLIKSLMNLKITVISHSNKHRKIKMQIFTNSINLNFYGVCILVKLLLSVHQNSKGVIDHIEFWENIRKNWEIYGSSAKCRQFLQFPSKKKSSTF